MDAHPRLQGRKKDDLRRDIVNFAPATEADLEARRGRFRSG